MTSYEIRKKIKKALAGTLIIANIVSSKPVYASEQRLMISSEMTETESLDSNGWHEYGGRYYYMEKGNRVSRRWKKIEGYWYYFDSEGYRYEDGGYQLKVGIDGSESTGWYCFDPNGRMVTGWYRPLSSNARYYYQDDGRAAKGMQKIDGVTYYFGRRGEMETDYIFENVERTCGYYFGADGKLTAVINLERDGWKKASDGNWYYVNSGKMLKNCWYFVGGHWYYFDDGGKMLKNIVVELYTSDKGWVCYRFDKNGFMITGWYQDEDGKWFGYDQSGAAFMGLHTIRDKIYYFDRDGILQVNGAVYLDGILYIYGPNGDCSVSSGNGWICDTYYVEEGNVVTGWKKISDKIYYFDQETGKKVSDTVQMIDGKYYSFNHEGVLETGRITNIDDDQLYWMYANPDGVLAVNEWVETDAARYYYDSSCRMATGIMTIEGRNELFGADGVWKETLETQGWQEDDAGDRYYINNNVLLIDKTQIIDGKYYHFDEDGRMIKNRFFENYYLGDQGALVTEQWKTDENGCRHYYGSDGRRYENGWKNIDSYWYYFKDGNAVTEDCLIDGKLYHFEKKGGSSREEILMADGWNEIAGQVYYRRDSLFLTGMQEIEKDRYYFYEDGHMACQTKIVDSVSRNSYFADQNGKIVFNAWCRDGDADYYAGRDGRLLTGLQMIGGKQYYFDEGGVMYHDDILQEDNSKLYVINQNGSISEIVEATTSGWICKNGNWFYVWDKKFQKGYTEIGRKSYYFLGNGQMAVDRVVEGYGYADAEGHLHLD